MPAHIHHREHLDSGDVVVIDCSHQANVMLTDDANYRQYKTNGKFSYFGGHFEKFPARIAAPRSGYWNITIDLGGGGANIRHSITIVRG
ncbi:MAG: hypothetical protein BGP06_09435 [Rhizobiales bacterium 65-9]|nr:DUF1883 domain-containing protein [Hyphomicrobiales bacterium]OJY38679.1 MAG: hypothetical protein BGP06_09435 [Rhizobiales bacterium 65-9]